MYKILGTDGNHYGPVSAEQVRTWVIEGRANGLTMAQAEGTSEWKKLMDFPAFADLATTAGPPLVSSLSMPGPSVVHQVTGPANGLLVVGVVGLILSIVGLVMNLTGVGMNLPGLDHNTEELMRALRGTVGVVSTVVSVLLSGIIFWGGMKMKSLQNYPLVLTASILAMIPCLSPCCLLGLPLGIWAVVVLVKPEVKAAFH